MRAGQIQKIYTKGKQICRYLMEKLKMKVDSIYTHTQTNKQRSITKCIFSFWIYQSFTYLMNIKNKVRKREISREIIVLLNVDTVFCLSCSDGAQS